MLEKILVGIDRSATADRALRWTVALAQQACASLVVATAMAPAQAETQPAPAGQERVRKRLEGDWTAPAR